MENMTIHWTSLKMSAFEMTWADDNWVRADWDAWIQANKDYTNKLRQEAGLEV